MTALFTTPEPAVAGPNRDRWGRPLIVPPEGGKAIPYTRVTTLAKTLEEQSALTAWKQRMTLIGGSLRPDIMLSVAAHRNDKQQLNKLSEQAMEAAQAGAKATIGTAVHSITETIDRGNDPGPIPAEYVPTIEAYKQATAGMRMVAVEQFVVLDDLQVAGTTDRILEWNGRRMIADLKTGNIDYSGMAIAIQLACYAQGVGYDVTEAKRYDFGDVDLETGLIIHLPAGEGVCTLVEVDLYAGWDAALQSVRVRDMRKSKTWMRPAKAVTAAPAAVEAAPVLPTEDQIADWIGQAGTVDHLTQLWQAHGPRFTPALNEVAAAQHALITGAVLAPTA